MKRVELYRLEEVCIENGWTMEELTLAVGCNITWDELGKQIECFSIILHQTMLVDPQEFARGEYLIYACSFPAGCYHIAVALSGDVHRCAGLSARSDGYHLSGFVVYSTVQFALEVRDDGG